MKKSNKSLKKLTYKILFVVSSLTFIVCLLMLIKIFIPQKNDMKQYHNPVATTTSASQVQEATEEETTLRDNPINFKKLQKVNKDVHGWIQIPDTNIDYVVVQSSVDKDDLFYLDHNLEGNYEFAGTIFSQKANSTDFRDHVTVLYGHNMLNGSMFHDLLKFRDSEFFEEHDEMYVYTPGHILTYKIVSAFTYDDRHILNTFNFNSKKDRKEYFDTINNPKSMDANVRKNFSAELDSRILTLSTCTDISSQRYLVQGVLINDEPTN